MHLVAALLLAVAAPACMEAVYGPQGPGAGNTDLAGPGVFIINEGAFTNGQASLSYYNGWDDTVYNQVFSGINGRPLGDVFQSMSFYRGKAFLVVNNSRKIEVVDSASFAHVATITGLTSPRAVLGAGDRLYVSDLYANEVTVLDADTYEVLQVIESGGWTESMLRLGDRIFITVQQLFVNNSAGTPKGLLVLHAPDGAVEGFVPLPQGANSLAADSEGKLWVLCDGGLEEETGGLFRIDPESLEVLRSLPLPSLRHSASRLQTGGSRQWLYFILSNPDRGPQAFDAYRMDISAAQLPDRPLIAGNGRYLYGLLADEAAGTVYVADAVGLIQEGFLYRYSLSDTAMLGRYTCGIFPGQMVARP